MAKEVDEAQASKLEKLKILRVTYSNIGYGVAFILLDFLNYVDIKIKYLVEERLSREIK